MSPKKTSEDQYTIGTRLIYGKSHTKEWEYSHHVVPPLTASSSFRLGSASRGAEGFGAIGVPILDTSTNSPIYVYDRMGEPNNDMLQHALATAEGFEAAVTFSTGMAAIHAAVAFPLTQNSEIVAHSTLYGCTYSLFTKWFSRFGIKVHFCDLSDPNAFLPLVNENTRVLYLESPANPTLQLLDVEAIMNRLNEINVKRDENHKILSVMDNTFSTPFAQRPGRFGVDVVVHSLTKGISGFGTDMGGAVITRREFQDDLILFRKDFGGNLSPQSAWHILVYGLSTLTLRVPKQQDNAQKIAEYLEKHPKVGSVRFPGLPSFPQYELAKRMLQDYEGKFAPGFMIYFTLKGDTPADAKARGERMMDYIAEHSYTITLAVSLGQVRTLIEHPGSMTHAAYPAEEQLKLQMDPGGIRLAVGLEDPADIIRDLETALEALESGPSPTREEVANSLNRGLI